MLDIVTLYGPSLGGFFDWTAANDHMRVAYERVVRGFLISGHALGKKLHEMVAADAAPQAQRYQVLSARDRPSTGIVGLGAAIAHRNHTGTPCRPPT